jgi:3-deoxy-7-phosphoheptulonate synthase
MIRAVRATGAQVLWVCDPMHGNTETTAGGVKTRRFDNILGEVEAAFRIHADAGSTLGGVHIELTGEDVTECIGGREVWPKPIWRGPTSRRWIHG